MQERALVALGVGKQERVTRRRALVLLGGTAGLITGADWHRLEAKKKVSPFKNIPVTATEDGGDRTFEGFLTIKKFKATPDGVVGVGKITGSIKDTQGAVQKKVKESVRLPVTEVDGVPPISNPNSADSDRVQAIAGIEFILALANLMIFSAFLLPALILQFPLCGSAKETNIVNEIIRHRDHPGGALPGLAFWLTRLIPTASASC